MNRVDGKVVLVTGAARGQGRSHAVRLAQEGAHIIAFDLCADIASNEYPLASPADLEETARLVKEAGQQVVTARVDVRDRAGLETALAEAVGSWADCMSSWRTPVSVRWANTCRPPVSSTPSM